MSAFAPVKPGLPGSGIAQDAAGPLTAGCLADQAFQELLKRRLASFAPNTQRALKSDWRIWYEWCADGTRHADSLPRAPFPARAEAVAEFIYAFSPAVRQSPDGTWALDLETPKPGVRSAKTLARYLSTLRTLHELAGAGVEAFKDPDVRHALRTVQRSRKGRSQSKAPICFSDLEQLLEEPSTDLRDARDKAMMALAYFALLRRSELVALTVEDIREQRGGSALVAVRFSKTDQGGEGQLRYLPPQGLAVLKQWQRLGGITEGPLFRKILRNGWLLERPLQAQEVARIFKRLAPRMSLDPKTIAGHSARIGAAHDLVSAGFGLAAVMQAGGWKSSGMPAHYAKGLDAHQGAMAQLIRRKTRRRASTRSKR